MEKLITSHFAKMVLEKPKNEDADEDACSKVTEGWINCKETSRVLSNENIPMKMKGKFYKIATRPAIKYKTEYLAVRKKRNIKFMWLK
ncbi:unnamed protein product [Diabrotica balteata]|uniref:Uncharacterized protein n=1 Tax=Diabrotica balteata TaxID=107213 RepID=A0A9N9X4Q6_DIABA|nr:unnamed protein product [Diabrotica balteata]